MGNSIQKNKLERTQSEPSHLSLKNNPTQLCSSKRIIISQQQFIKLSKKFQQLCSRESTIVHPSSDDEQPNKKNIQIKNKKDPKLGRIVSFYQNQNGNQQNQSQRIKDNMQKVDTNYQNKKQTQIFSQYLYQKQKDEVQKSTKQVSGILFKSLIKNNQSQISEYQKFNTSFDSCKAKNDPISEVQSIACIANGDMKTNYLQKIVAYKMCYDQQMKLFKDLHEYKYNGDLLGQILQLCNRHFNQLIQACNYLHQNNKTSQTETNRKNRCIRLSGVQEKLFEQEKLIYEKPALLLFQEMAKSFLFFIDRVEKKAKIEINKIKQLQEQKYNAIMKHQQQMMKQHQKIITDLHVDLQFQHGIFKQLKKKKDNIQIDLRQKDSELECCKKQMMKQKLQLQKINQQLTKQRKIKIKQKKTQNLDPFQQLNIQQIQKQRKKFGIDNIQL